MSPQRAEWEGDAPVWALAGLGQMDPALVREVAGDARSLDLEARLAPMWTRNGRNWLNQNQPSDALNYLERQRVRHTPPQPT